MQYSTDNTHAPQFSSILGEYAHYLGDYLVTPCHYGFNQLMRFTDPFRRGRSKELYQYSFWLEVFLARPIRLVFGLIFFIAGIPFALLGQAIKVVAALIYKENFAYYHYEQDANDSDDLNPQYEEDNSNTLKITSWNLAAQHTLLRRYNGTRPIEARMPEIINHLRNSDNDVLCFQEVFTEKATKTLVAGLQKRYPYIIHNIGKNIIGVNSGLMILSKYPFEHIEFEPFNERYGQNRFSQKGVCGAIVNKNEQRIVITNVHLEAGGGGLKAKEAQISQTLTLRNRLENQISNQHNMISIFAGDTNLPEKKYNKAIAKDAHSPIKTLFNQYHLNPVGNNTCLKERILAKENKSTANSKPGGDYIGVHDESDQFTNQVTIQTSTNDSSDHYPVTATICKKTS